jgi:ubiquinone/menaquinone biosynthesis C-methylase UbiE
MDNSIFSIIGDRYYGRRKPVMESLSTNWEKDYVINAIPNPPKNVLEIGCSYGWRVNRIREKYGCKCSGIDPSGVAIIQGKSVFPDLDLVVGVAEDLPYRDGEFDLVIFGWCLYTCAREGLFKIAYQADRVLSKLGYLIILDFSPIVPQYKPSVDYRPMYTYKMDYGTMFSWHPAYSTIADNVFTDPERNDRVGVVVFQKIETP